MVRDRDAEAADVEREAERIAAMRASSAPIWPDRYSEMNFESAFRFLTECWWTDDDERQRIELIPPSPHIEEFVWDWTEAFNGRIPWIWEKSRRMYVSWAARGLETRIMGITRGAWLLTDQTEENAEAHLWRCHFSLDQLYARRPDLHLPVHRAKGTLSDRLASSIVLANGSTLSRGHQKALSLQGKGKTGITMEELSKYRNAEAYWGQALIVTRGGAGGQGGWVCGIANPSQDPLWRELKCSMKPLELLGWA